MKKLFCVVTTNLDMAPEGTIVFHIRAKDLKTAEAQAFTELKESHDLDASYINDYIEIYSFEVDDSSIIDVKEIEVGSIVAYQEPGASRAGWYRVRRVTKNTVNLGSIFGRALYHKSVPKDQVREDEAAWYAAWRKTDQYQSM